MTERDDVDTMIAINDTISALKKADKWRWHKRNTGAIELLTETRIRLEKGRMAL